MRPAITTTGPRVEWTGSHAQPPTCWALTPCKVFHLAQRTIGTAVWARLRESKLAKYPLFHDHWTAAHVFRLARCAGQIHQQITPLHRHGARKGAQVVVAPSRGHTVTGLLPVEGGAYARRCWLASWQCGFPPRRWTPSSHGRLRDAAPASPRSRWLAEATHATLEATHDRGYAARQVLDNICRDHHATASLSQAEG